MSHFPAKVLCFLLSLRVLTLSQELQHGVYFSPPTPLTMITETHQLVLTFNISKAIEYIDKVRFAVDTVSRTKRSSHPLFDHFYNQLNDLGRTLRDQQAGFQAFLETSGSQTPTHNTHQQTRKKRTPLIGSVVATIFGLPTEDEITSIVSQTISTAH